MVRTLLVIDDVQSNRDIIKHILGSEYAFLEAADGREALDIMERSYEQISAVLLDLGMPVMDGFAVLEHMRQSKTLSLLPVIVTTGLTAAESEVKALKLGATDYISKPYNPIVIKQRIWNAIHLRETAATVNILRRDRLTGLYNREIFFEKIQELALAHEPGYYVMASLDINKFKVINDQYGTQKGDEVLKHIADIFSKGLADCGGIFCRIASDDFAAFYPYSFLDSPEPATLRKKASAVEGLIAAVTFSIGRYRVDDLALSPSAMYDRATIACESVKGRYDTQIAAYDESMRNHLLLEQEIVTEMESALHSDQFEVWYQPQYNHATGALIGSEALVRWRHPQKGLISPGLFIPVFEQNGFIYELDKYVWSTVCRNLRVWLDEGREALPVSVNISRYDLFRADIIDVIMGLVKKYEIPATLLRLEITESAFAESTNDIVRIVKQLIDLGFTVEIDDFGSGYSSLNTLKSVPAQVVKLDMRFFEDSEDTQRSGNIVESVVRMAKWLGMSVIAEGVEQPEQADYLLSIGCNYLQGYLYAKPMPREEYKKHCTNSKREKKLLTMETVENLDNGAFWNPKSMDTLIFNTYVGGACIFEYRNGKIEILRANRKYAKTIGGDDCTTEYVLSMEWAEHMDESAASATRAAIDAAIASGDDITYEAAYYGLPGAKKTYLRTTFRLLARTNDRYLLYSLNENITAQRAAEQREHELAEEIRQIMANVDGGICAFALNEDGSTNIIFGNEKFYALTGYNKEFTETYKPDIFTAIYPDDRTVVHSELAKLIRTRSPRKFEFRCVRNDGSVIYTRSNISIASLEGFGDNVVIAVNVDVTAEKKAELELKESTAQTQRLLDDMPGGFVRMRVDKNGGLHPVYCNDGFLKLVGMSVEELSRLHGADGMSGFHPNDVPILREALQALIRDGEASSRRFRIRHGKDSFRWVIFFGRAFRMPGGDSILNLYFTDVTTDTLTYQQMLPIALSTVIGSSSDIAFVKDRDLRYVCCSPAFVEISNAHSVEEVIGKTDADVFPVEDSKRYHEIDVEIVRTGRARLDYSENLATSGDTLRYGSTSKYPLLDSGGNVIGIYGVTRDITEFRSAYERLKLLTDSIEGGLATYVCTRSSIRISYVNEAFRRLFGYSREEFDALAAENALFMVEKDEISQIFTEVRALIFESKPMHHSFRVHTKSGEIKWVNVRATLSGRSGASYTINAVFFDITELMETNERLRLSEEENRLAIQHSKTVVCRYDVTSRLMSISPSVNPIFNLNPFIEDVPGGEVRNGHISPETAPAYTRFFEEISRGEKSGTAVYQRTSSLGWRWIEAHSSTIFTADGKPASAVISFSDVTERLEKEAVYKKWQQALENKGLESYTLFRCNISKDGSFDVREGNLLQLVFDNSLQTFNERVLYFAEKCVYERDQARYIAFLDSGELLVGYYRGKRADSMEFRQKLPDGSISWRKLSVELVEFPNSTDIEAYLMYEDINDTKLAEFAVKEQAETDPLTGILNRAAFAEAMEDDIRASRPGALHALLMLDIDGFKQVNDVFGHAAGDQTLIDIALVLRGVLRHGDLVGRLGGDEFVIFLRDIESAADAQIKAKQICERGRRFLSAEVEISSSIGIALSPVDGCDFETLYMKADRALYYVKGNGKDNYAMYTDDMIESHHVCEAVPAPAAEPGAKKRRMLIVDDSGTDHAILTNIFAEDFIVDNAKDGNLALSMMRHFGSSISVVLLDMVMPGLDGIGVLKQMKQNAELKNIPVIVVSSYNDRENCLKAISAGASDFVTKPVDPELLRIRVELVIKKASSERANAKNSSLEYQSAELQRYKTVLSQNSTVVVEYDWVGNTFIYDDMISGHIAGSYDNRALWHIFLADFVADTATVKKIQELVHSVASGRQKANISTLVLLKTPKGTQHWFRMSIYRLKGEYSSAAKLYLAFTDLGAKPQEQQGI